MDNGACIPLRVHTIVISTQHSEEVTLQQLRDQIMESVVKVTTMINTQTSSVIRVPKDMFKVLATCIGLVEYNIVTIIKKSLNALCMYVCQLK